MYWLSSLTSPHIVMLYEKSLLLVKKYQVVVDIQVTCILIYQPFTNVLGVSRDVMAPLPRFPS